MFVVQNILYCLLFIGLVKCAVRNNGLNCLYFYPPEFIEEAQKRGIADKEATMKKGKQFMIPFCIVIFFILVPVIACWNHVTDFKTAFIQAYILLVVMNWFDGIVLDRLWVAHGKVWVIEGMEGVPYIKPWKSVLVKRTLAMILYLAVAALIAGLVVLVGRI